MAFLMMAETQSELLLMTLNIIVLAGVVGFGFMLHQMNHKLEELNKKQ